MVRLLMERSREQNIDLEKKFEPTLLNTAIYLLGLSQQVSTFVLNFQVCSSAAFIDDTEGRFRDDRSARVFERTHRSSGDSLVSAPWPTLAQPILFPSSTDGSSLSK